MNNNFAPMQPVVINPRSIDRQRKDAAINDNILQCGFKIYNMCPWQASMRIRFRKDFNRGNVNSVCKVLVEHKHALDVVGGLVNKGLTEIKSNNKYPAIINPMFREFTGRNSKSNDATADENILLRTNYSFVVQRQENLFPTSNDSEVVYSAPITVIRDPFYNMIPHEYLYRTGVITVTPHDTELLDKIINDGDRYDKKKVLRTQHLLKLQTQLETAFQVAAMGGHNAVIVSLFDQEYGIPVDDQIMLYNYCIMKYGHFFGAIIFAIPPYQPAELKEYIGENIIKPQRIASDIEMDAKADIMTRKFQGEDLGGEGDGGNGGDGGDGGDDDEVQERPDPSSMTEEQKMAYMKKVVKSKRREVRAKAEKAPRKSKSKSKSRKR